MTKKEHLTEQLALEKAVRLGICGCFVNLIVEHARVLGGDQSKALAGIQAAMKHTASSLKVNATDSAGSNVEISEFIQQSVNKILDQMFQNAQKRISRSVH